MSQAFLSSVSDELLFNDSTQRYEEVGRYLQCMLENAGILTVSYPYYFVCYASPRTVLDALGTRITSLHAARIYTYSDSSHPEVQTRVSIVKGVRNYIEQYNDIVEEASRFGLIQSYLLAMIADRLGVRRDDLVPCGKNRFRIENCPLPISRTRDITDTLPSYEWTIYVRQEWQYTMVYFTPSSELDRSNDI